MPTPCLLYYITDRTAFPGDEPACRRRLLEKIAEATRAGVDYIQLREKDLPTRELEQLAREAVRIVREARKATSGLGSLAPALLINSRTDVALAVGVDGVHLRSDDVSPQEVRKVWQRCVDTLSAESVEKPHFSRQVRARNGAPASPKEQDPALEHTPRAALIGVSCHTAEEVVKAAANGANFAVFAPVFEKKDAPGTQPTGLAMLEQASRANIPVLALGGVTLANARACPAAGAAGIAAIRLFQENDIEQIVRTLRG